MLPELPLVELGFKQCPDLILSRLAYLGFFNLRPHRVRMDYYRYIRLSVLTAICHTDLPAQMKCRTSVEVDLGNTL
jgi:hypothetical protein